MSQVSTSSSGNLTSSRPGGQAVAVPRPGQGAEVVVQSSPGGRLDFGFDPGQASFSRPENSNDLVFEFEGGGKVTISGFFEVGDESLPALSLPDGLEVAAVDFFAGSDIDMTTAAGPRSSGGGTSYADNAGDLIDGLDRLGSLGTEQWDTSVDSLAEPLAESIADDRGALFMPPPVLTIVPPLYDGNAAMVMEGEDLVFNIEQSRVSDVDVGVSWSVTVPADDAPGVASYADFDKDRFEELGITTIDNGDGTLTLTGTVTVPAGSDHAEIHIPTLDDTQIESDERLTLVITDVTGGAILPDNAPLPSFDVVIRDNDLLVGPVDPNNPDPNNPNNYVTNGNAAFTVEGGELVFTIGQSSPSTADTTVDWSITIPGESTSGKVSYVDLDEGQFAANDISVSGPDADGNYVLSGTVTIKAGEQTGIITIPTTDDELFELDESLQLELSNQQNTAADNISLAGTGSYNGVVADNDGADILSLSIGDARAVEGGTLEFTVTQSGESGADTTADWSITIPATSTSGEVSYADLDNGAFTANGITAENNGDGTWTLSG
ncbi:MAG: hypothetical protein LBR82_03170, partial [Desulfovibrio sp.]|nr:hypothetical protein [Desulfovibrio sp.]